jgi:carnosine synthase
MGGGQVRATHLRVFHVDLVEETLFGCVGIPNRPHKAEPPLCHLAYNYVNARKSGKVVSTAAVKAIESLPDVVYSKALVREGEYITGPEDGMPTWVADVMVSKPNANEALQYVLKLSETLNVPIAAPVSFKPAREE